jgi:Spy/CpxP family protein refolding chaperone
VVNTRLKAYAALAGMFVLGGLCSAAAYHAFARRDADEFFSADPKTFESRRVEALERELELDDGQRLRIHEIFQRHAVERKRLLGQAMETCGGPMEAHRARVDAEIRAVLTPSQQSRYETLRAERRRRLFGDAHPQPSAR